MNILMIICGCRGGGSGSGSDQSSREQTISAESSAGASQSVSEQTSGSKIETGSPSSESGQGEVIATLQQPEPTTMLLLGSGMLAMALYKKIKTKKSL